jgi:hypothetical protein
MDFLCTDEQLKLRATVALATEALLRCTDEADGGERHVLDGHIADLIMVGARTPAGIGLFAVDGAAAGLRRVPVPTLDQTRKQAHLEFAIRAEDRALAGQGRPGREEHHVGEFAAHRGVGGPDDSAVWDVLIASGSSAWR